MVDRGIALPKKIGIIEAEHKNTAKIRKGDEMKIDTPQKTVLKAFQKFGFEVVDGGRREHIKLRNAKGIMVSLPNHKTLKGSTLQRICRDAQIDRKLFWQYC